MTFAIARLLVVVAAALAGAAVAPAVGLGPVGGALLGAASGGAAVGLEILGARAPLHVLLWASAGVVAGLVAGLALGTALAGPAGEAGPAVRAAVTLLAAWAGGAVGARRAGELPAPGRSATEPGAHVLDTSVIIDGRIADIAQAGFLAGTLIVPQFVVRELQRLADVADPLRRSRGRRGFDVLEQLRSRAGLHVEVDDTDVTGVAEVDAKLVALARARGARLLTNDVALARTAALAGVAVGSVHDLAQALRPVALAGEALHVQLVREGKEHGQGVGYLEDGTLVVVEGGKRFIGQSLDVVVTSVLQTSAGRMIFARRRGEETGRDA
jgi:uncharacterized protein YacL